MSPSKSQNDACGRCDYNDSTPASFQLCNAMKHRVALLLACTWCAVTTPVFRAQSAPPAGRQPEVTFQVEVNYVDVDAVVTDQQGNFVRGLTKDDFQLFEDGKPQKIDLFSAVDIPVERQNPPTFAGRQIREDIKSNMDALAGRVYVLVLDDLNTSVLRSAYVRKVARQFIEQNLGANDVAAVVNTSGLTDASAELHQRFPAPARCRRQVSGAEAPFLDPRLAGHLLPAADAQVLDGKRCRRRPESLGERSQCDIGGTHSHAPARLVA